MKNLIAYFLLGITLLILASCGSPEVTKAAVPTDIIPVKIIPVEKSEYQSAVIASGQFTTEEEMVLSFKTGGIISNVFVREGDRVKRGQILATLDLTEISAQVKQAQLALEKAQRDFKRAENLYRDSVATLEQLQNAKTGLELYQQQYNSAQFNLTYSEIRAVQDGIVLRKLASAGQLTGPGTPVLRLNNAGSDNWILKAGVSDREWARIQLNDKAIVESDAFDKKLEGKVSAKSEGADPVTGSFTVEIKLDQKQVKNIAAGMFGKTTIQTASQTNIWKIPYDALLDGNGNKGFVFVTNDEKTATKVPVTIASLGKNELLISEGLENSKALIITGSAYLTNGSKISVSK